MVFVRIKKLFLPRVATRIAMTLALASCISFAAIADGQTADLNTVHPGGHAVLTGIDVLERDGLEEFLQRRGTFLIYD